MEADSIAWFALFSRFIHAIIVTMFSNCSFYPGPKETREMFFWDNFRSKDNFFMIKSRQKPYALCGEVYKAVP